MPAPELGGSHGFKTARGRQPSLRAGAGLRHVLGPGESQPRRHRLLTATPRGIASGLEHPAVAQTDRDPGADALRGALD